MAYQIPIILELDADNIDEARQKACRILQDVMIDDNEDAFLANDDYTDAQNRRIIILHPIDTSIENYDPAEYAKILKEKEKLLTPVVDE